MQESTAGNHQIGHNWHNQAHSAAEDQGFHQQPPTIPWELWPGHWDDDLHSVGHSPRIARRIARKFYGIQDPEAWTRKARLSLL